MKNMSDALLDQLKKFSGHKKDNFGSIPDDYREMIEELLASKGPAMFLLRMQTTASTNFPKLIEYIKDCGAGKLTEMGQVDDNSMAMAIHVNGDKFDVKDAIKQNWDLFEPAFMFLYLGIKMGRQMERDEIQGLKAMLREERQKENPNAFDSIAPIALPAVSDSPDHPAVTPEKAEAWRKELEQSLKTDKDSN